MFCNSPSLPNPCNDIVTFFYTNSIFLKRVSSLFKMILKLLYKKIECDVFYSSSILKLFLHPRTQQQAVYKSIHSFLTPYSLLSMPYTLINQAHICELLSFSLQKQCFNIHNMLHKYTQNKCNSKSIISLILLSCIATMLAEIQGETSKKSRRKRK